MEFRNKNIKRVILAVSLAATAVILCLFTGCSQGDSQNINVEGLYHSQKGMTNRELAEEAWKCFYTQPDSAYFYYSVIAARYNPKMPVDEQWLYAHACMNIGNLYFYEWSNYQQAMVYFLKALEVARKYNLTKAIMEGYFNIGSVHSVFGDVEFALDYYKKAFYLAVEQKNWQVTHAAFANIGSDALEYGLLPSVQRELEIFGGLQIPDDFPMKKHYRCFYEALMAVRDGHYDLAYVCFDAMERAIPADNPGVDRAVAFTLLNKQDVYNLEKNYTEALRTSLRAMKVMENQDGMDDLQVINFKNISRYYKIFGKETEAMRYMDKALKTQDNHLNAKKLNQIHHIKTAYEMDRMGDRIRTEERKRRTQGHILWIVVIALSVSTALLVKVFYQKKDLEQKSRSLYTRMREILEQNERDKALREQVEKTTVGAKPISEKETEQAQEVKYKNSSLDQERKEALLNHILSIMDQSGEIYSEDFSIGRLSRLANANEKYISQVINELCHKNFNDLLAEYRIKEACRRITDTEHYGNLTIEGIANGLGFKSRGNFYTVFKKIVGLSPSQYRNFASNSEIKSS